MTIRLRCFVAILGLALACSPEHASQAAEPSEFTDVNSSLLAAQAPAYPEAARAHNLTGWGIVRLEIDRRTGAVTRAYMERSTGERVLDQAALEAYRQWRFQPGTLSHARLPIIFTPGNARGTVRYEYHEKPMEKVLARFIGEDNVVKASLPTYPILPPWTLKTGRGIYELHVRNDGTVERVVTVKSSGDEVFDRINLKALNKWRFRRGPMTLELPLHFTLTPISYSVDIAR